jgi:hypothetical protein
MEEKKLVNKVAQKDIHTIDLKDYIVSENHIATIDLKDFLWQNLILREADFREKIKNTDWSIYLGKYTAIFCSVNAIVPQWAFMILAANLSPFAKDIAYVSPTDAKNIFTIRNIEQTDFNNFKDKRIIIKGCGDEKLEANAFVAITSKLALLARAILYGEPCSTVPVYKKTID